MEIVRKEKVELTIEESKLLNNAYALLTAIYREATDDEICDRAETATNALADLLDYCE